MKFLHLSDLHLGKRLNEFSLLEDQKDILTKILAIVEEQQPDGVLIAGDVYDKAVPSAEAVSLFDDFLTRLAALNTQVFVISGNHDSAERLAFGSRLMEAEGIHTSRVYDGTFTPVTMEDSLGPVDVWLLPFIKPGHVRRLHPEAESYTDAVRLAISDMPIDPARRNVLVTHQFVTGSRLSESEELNVGGTDNIDVSVFDGFDYVALGHIHSPQNCGSPRVRYCGTPLKYSFSEARDEKSVTVVELGAELTVSTIPLTPMREMVELRGTYDRLISRDFYKDTRWQEDYVHITLTDEEDIPDAAAKLRSVYHNLMKLTYDNTRTRTNRTVEAAREVTRSPLELFGEFYTLQNNQPMTQEQEDCIRKLIQEIWEDNV